MLTCCHGNNLAFWPGFAHTFPSYLPKSTWWTFYWWSFYHISTTCLYKTRQSVSFLVLINLILTNTHGITALLCLLPILSPQLSFLQWVYQAKWLIPAIYILFFNWSPKGKTEFIIYNFVLNRFYSWIYLFLSCAICMWLLLCIYVKDGIQNQLVLNFFI